MSYYLPTVLIESVKLDDSMARLIAACASVAYLFASLIAAPLVEKLGRRVMMMVSTVIQLFCFLLVTVLLSFAEQPGYAHTVEVSKASVVWFVIYYMGFGLGMLGVSSADLWNWLRNTNQHFIDSVVVPYRNQLVSIRDTVSPFTVSPTRCFICG